MSKNLTGIYVRLSDEDRDKRRATDESESIQNQKSMLINYCMEQGWQIYDIYCDDCVIIGISLKSLIKPWVFGTCPFHFF